MTGAGVLLLDLAGVALLISLLNSVRKGRLYVGYGVIFVVAVLSVLVTATVPGLLHLVQGVVARFFPDSPLAVIGFGFHTLLLIYVLGQLTILSNRLARVVQELAIRNVRMPESVSPDAPRGGRERPEDPATP